MEGRLLLLKNEWNNLDENTKRALLDVAKQFEFTNETPSWYDKKNNKIDEVEFCTWFISKHPLKYVGGIFYDIDGIISEEKLRSPMPKRLLLPITCYAKRILIP